VPALTPSEARVLFDQMGLTTAVRCIDVGAMALSEPDPWSLYTEQGCTTVVGFEPNEEECRKLQQQASTGHTLLPLAIGDGAEWPLHITNTGMTSQPAADQIGRFVFAAVLEGLNNLASYSSFYSPAASLERLRLIEKLGYADQNTRTAIQLIQRRQARRAAAQR
jgi:hypothetical protein